MLICCESCKKIYSYEENDGLCPKCGCYNNISHQDAARLELERKTRRYQRLAQLEEERGSLCDAEDAGSAAAASVFAPDCMENNHIHTHVHTGGANLAARQSAAATGTAAKSAAARQNPALYRSKAASSPAQNRKNKVSALIFSALIWVIFILIVFINLAAGFFS